MTRIVWNGCSRREFRSGGQHISRILIPSNGPDDWRQLLARPERQWKRGRSAMAAALSWEAATGGAPPEVALLLGEAPELLLAIPEHRVALPGGGRGSQCDVFALVRDGSETIAVAVEAKVSEPFGPKLAEWRKNASPGKRKRLNFICARLGLPPELPGDLRYQLLHRAAAAVIEMDRFKTDRAALIVQSFSEKHRGFEDFAHFVALFGLDLKPGQSGVHVLPCGKPLTLGWAVGDPRYL